MQNDFREDPKAVWQDQPAEATRMTLENLQLKARQLHAKTRWDLIKSIAGPVIVAAICAFGMRFAGPAMRAALAFAFAWSLSGQYFLNRGMWPTPLPGEAAFQTGLASYRQEIERRRSLSGRFLLWWFGPVIFAIATSIVLLLNLGMSSGLLLEGTLIKMSPFLSLMAIWVIVFFFIRIRQRRDLQREIDELNAIESAS